MKMETINISMPAPLAEFARQRAEKTYGNMSEFFRDLLRQKMQAEIDADLKFLESSSKGAPVGPSEEDIQDILAAQKRARKKLHKAL